MEDRDTRLRRLRLRSMRRGLREADLILDAFARAQLAALDGPETDLYERLLEEADHDILAWVTGAAPPAAYAPLVARLRAQPIDPAHPEGG
jgi:antitoxin CptB